jgi:D-alanyl-lipoteichoic acid acyltransferase DltB (MBOAT superfamily)
MPIFDTTAFFQQLLYDAKHPLLFNDGFFVFFFGIFIILYYYFRNNFPVRKFIFCAFSLYFFYKASGYFVIVVFLAAIVDFVLSNAIYREQLKKRKLILLVGSIVFNLGILIYFKYTNFFISFSNDLFKTGFNPLNIILPVGISFFTFENLSYTIDVYRGNFKPARKFSDYLLFLSFFPKLVMGPIVRAHDFVPQINQPYHVNEHDFAKGFYLMVSGMFKKLIISDFLTLNFVNFVFDDPARFSGWENLFAVYAYALVIYCDFSGYSDVAIGIAKWLGFNIPANFLSPYQSKNISEFWRRWHISLSSWLRDYLYIPLGGNRESGRVSKIIMLLFFVGLFFGLYFFAAVPIFSSLFICIGLLFIVVLPGLITKKHREIHTNYNLLATMLVGGLWHGASWNFVIWGAIHGFGLVTHKIWKLIFGNSLTNVKTSFLYKMITTLLTFNFVCLGWVFFKAANISTASLMLQQIYFNLNPQIFRDFVLGYRFVLVMMVFGYLLHAIPDHWADAVITLNRTIKLRWYILVFFIFIIIYGFFKSSAPVMPIYLQF